MHTIRTMCVHVYMYREAGRVKTKFATDDYCCIYRQMGRRSTKLITYFMCTLHGRVCKEARQQYI